MMVVPHARIGVLAEYIYDAERRLLKPSFASVNYEDGTVLI